MNDCSCKSESVLSLSLMLGPTVSWPVCLGIQHLSGAYDQIFITVKTVAGLLTLGALSDERRGMSFRIVAGPRQRSHSQVWVPWDSRPYYTVSDSRLPFSSPPTTRRATVEIFNPASTREWSLFLCYDRRFSRPVCLGIKHPSGSYDQIFITVTQLKACWCGALSLTRGRVCPLPDSVSSNTSLVSMYNLHVTSY
jgi:hypothetical protein